MYQHIKVPAEGQKITVNADFSLNVPNNPIIPFIEGDGTGVDISPVMMKVVDAISQLEGVDPGVLPSVKLPAQLAERLPKFRLVRKTAKRAHSPLNRFRQFSV